MSGERRVVGGVVAGLGGLCLAVQARVNGQLGVELRDGLFAALVSFSVGLVILLVVVLCAPGARRGLGRFREAVRTRRLRPWQCLGGAAGAFYVTAQGLTATLLGVAVFTVAVVAGQVVSSLVVDRLGIGPAGPQPVTVSRMIGAGLAVLAVGVAVSDELGDPQHLWLALVPALGGVGMGWQQAVNGQVRVAAGSVAFASMVNFAVGAVGLGLACAVDAAVRGLPEGLPQTWWLYLGGAIGVLGISAAVYAVRVIGVLMVGLCAVAGQLVGAVVLDVVGGRLQLATVLGVVVVLVATGVAAVPSRTVRG